jgi:hypothetical protein
VKCHTPLVNSSHGSGHPPDRQGPRPPDHRAPGPQTDRAPGVAEAEAAAAVLQAFVAGLEAECYSGEDAVSLVALFTRIERLGVAGKTLAAHRVDQCHAHLPSGHRSAAEFLAAATGDSVGEAKGLLALGEDLADRPGLEEAFRGGKLSRSRATLLADAVRVNPAREDDLLHGARSDSHTTFKERCLKAKAEGRTSEDEARHHRALHDRRRCRTYTDSEGAFRLDASLAPDVGARVRSALEAQSHRLFEQARASGRWENPDAYQADALVALVTGTGVLPPRGRRTTGDTPAGGTPVRTRTPAPPSSSGSTSRPCGEAGSETASAARSPGSDRCPWTGPEASWVPPWSICWSPTGWTSPRSTHRAATSRPPSGPPSWSGTPGAWSPAVTAAWAWRTTTGSPTSPREAAPPSTTWPGSAATTTASARTGGSSSSGDPGPGSGCPRRPPWSPSGPQGSGPRPRPTTTPHHPGSTSRNEAPARAR